MLYYMLYYKLNITTVFTVSYTRYTGLRLWAPLWQYGTPDVVCFSSRVKPCNTSSGSVALYSRTGSIVSNDLHKAIPMGGEKQLKVTQL